MVPQPGPYPDFYGERIMKLPFERRNIYAALFLLFGFCPTSWAVPKIQILVRISHLAALVEEPQKTAEVLPQDRQQMLWVAEAEEGHVSLGEVPLALADALKKDKLVDGDLEGAQRRIAVSAKREGPGFVLYLVPEIVLKKDARVVRLETCAAKFEVPSGEPAEAGSGPGKNGVAKEFFSDANGREWKLVLIPLAL